MRWITVDQPTSFLVPCCFQEARKDMLKISGVGWLYLAATNAARMRVSEQVQGVGLRVDCTQHSRLAVQ